MKKQKPKALPSRSLAKQRIKPQGIPLVVLYWAAGLGLLGYVGSRFFVAQHPLHWASGIGGLLLGVIIGYIWFLKRGDVDLL